MAGNFPDVPSWRIPYDRDGTILLSHVSTLVPTDISSVAADLNDEGLNRAYEFNSVDTPQTMVFLFPRLMDLDAIFIGVTSRMDAHAWSPDTTNGIDGTWNELGNIDESPVNAVSVRTNIQPLGIEGVRALRLQSGHSFSDWQAIHLFGAPSVGEDIERLQIVPAGTEDRVAPAQFDLADVPQSSSRDVEFRVKNLSNSTAEAVVVSLQFPTESNPTLASQHFLSTDGETFTASVDVGNLAPDEVSEVVILRQSLDPAVPLSLKTGRIVASATTWA